MKGKEVEELTKFFTICTTSSAFISVKNWCFWCTDDCNLSIILLPIPSLFTTTPSPQPQHKKKKHPNTKHTTTGWGAMRMSMQAYMSRVHSYATVKIYSIPTRQCTETVCRLAANTNISKKDYFWWFSQKEIANNYKLEKHGVFAEEI